LGLSDREVNSVASLRIPYRDESGKEISTRYRFATSGDKFRRNNGAKLMLYGLDRLDRSVGYVHLVEGESDAHTLWLHGEPALGCPEQRPGKRSGRSSWRDSPCTSGRNRTPADRSL
jgi:hypothetical protein